LNQDLKYLTMPRKLLGTLRPRDAVVFSFLHTQRDRATGYCWPSIEQICDATGYAERAVERALAFLQWQTVADGRALVEAEEIDQYCDPTSFGASEYCKAKKFYQIPTWAVESKAPAWLIAMPASEVCGRAKILAFLLGGLQEYCELKDLEWRGQHTAKSAKVLGISKSQYCRAFLQLCKVGAFTVIQRRKRHATLVKLSYGGPSDVRYKRGRGRGTAELDAAWARFMRTFVTRRPSFSAAACLRASVQNATYRRRCRLKRDSTASETRPIERPKRDSMKTMSMKTSV
jgi:hypothetical protein